MHLAGRQDYHDNGGQSKGKGRFQAGQSSSQAEGAAQANRLQHGKGKRKQPASGHKCFNCGGTSHWSRECPTAQLNNDNKVGCHLHSITSDPVVSAAATGANAVPIRRKVLGLVARVRLKTARSMMTA